VTEIKLSYKRDSGTTDSTGSIAVIDSVGTLHVGIHPVNFEHVDFQSMLKLLCKEIAAQPAEEELAVWFHRTDREGLLPYRLDKSTVELLRTDPVAGIASFMYPTQSPSVIEQQLNQVPIPPPLVRVGDDMLAQSFGEVLFFRVRGHELECPGCGFWGMYTTPGLLAAGDREGREFKTIFACKKKCQQRFVVNCLEKWGSVSTYYLLNNTTLEEFYFPREWNEGRSWVDRATLKILYEEFKKETNQ
jgi:hypothetical protein